MLRSSDWKDPLENVPFAAAVFHAKPTAIRLLTVPIPFLVFFSPDLSTYWVRRLFNSEWPVFEVQYAQRYQTERKEGEHDYGNDVSHAVVASDFLIIQTNIQLYETKYAIYEQKSCIDEELDKVLVVFGANADVDDIAMVVVKLGAYVAGSTMVNVLPPINVTFFADECMTEVDFVVVLVVILARYVCKNEPQVAGQPYGTEYVEQKRRHPQAISVHEILSL